MIGDFGWSTGFCAFNSVLSLCTSATAAVSMPEESIFPVVFTGLGCILSVLAAVGAIDAASEVKKKALMVTSCVSAVLCLESAICSALAAVKFYQCISIIPVNPVTAEIVMNSEDQCTVEAVRLLYSSMAFLVGSIIMCAYSCVREILSRRKEFIRLPHLKI